MSSFSQQTTLFLQSCILGMIFAINYDFFRAIRREFRLKFIGILFCDTFFWIENITLFLLFILNFASGEGRMYIIFAIILGATLYFLSIGEILLRILQIVFRFIRKCIIFLQSILKKLNFIVSRNCLKYSKQQKEKQ